MQTVAIVAPPAKKGGPGSSGGRPAGGTEVRMHLQCCDGCTGGSCCFQLAAEPTPEDSRLMQTLAGALAARLCHLQKQRMEVRRAETLVESWAGRLQGARLLDFVADEHAPLPELSSPNCNCRTRSTP